MSNELIINKTSKGARIALLQDKELVEFHKEQIGNTFNVGDIYLGTVRKLVPGLNAAFVDVGYEKDAFLHYLDLGPKIKSLNKHVKNVSNGKLSTSRLNKFKMEPEIEKTGKIPQVFVKNQKVLVQVAKEPISQKGPRLTCELSLAGRYIVLVPFSNVISVSKKIANNGERKRLAKLMTSIKPENFGVIIRTVAEGKEVAELDRDLRNLLATWDKGMEKLQTAEPRDKVIGEIDRSTSLIRDLLNESFDSITIDDQNMLEETKEYIRTIAPDKEKIVKPYSSKAKLFEQKGIEKQLKVLFGKSVSIPGGGYLIIEHTEALHVVDVNSGNKSNIGENQENTALQVNMMAVTEVARQLRLRDMGGIIVIDFIDMRKPENRKQVYDRMRDLLKLDRAKSVVLPLSKFGLLQITRQRVRPEMNISTSEACPTCNGSGKVGTTIALVERIEEQLEHMLVNQKEKKVTLVVHPYIHAYLTKGLFSRQYKWKKKFKKKIPIEIDSSIGMIEYHFKDINGEEFQLD
ncbi:MAG: Rne/Rng family ribonuclease [Cyclobacteriaceae bacterium]